MTRREYKAGRPTTLTGAGLAISGTSFTIANDTNWPTGADYPFWVTIDGGESNEERILCSARSGLTVTVAASGRGKDTTTESNHASGATVWPSWSATDADEANAHINLTTGIHGYSATAAEINILDGATLSTAELNILDGVTASTAELNYVDGVTSNIQTQLDARTLLNAATNAQVASYTLVLADNGKYVEMNNASANVLTVPPNSSVAFPVGTQVTIIQTGAGTTTITPGAGVTVNYYSLTGAATRTIKAQWAAATLIKRATDTWVLIGNLG
jgi:hypothetical protein